MYSKEIDKAIADLFQVSKLLARLNHVVNELAPKEIEFSQEYYDFISQKKARPSCRALTQLQN